MQRINSLENLNLLLSKSFIKGTITNNYMLIDAYKTYISEKKLYVVSNKTNTYFLLDKGDFYQLYYFLNDLNVPFQINVDKSIVMEVLYRGESKRPNEVIQYWEKYGFKQHILRQHMYSFYEQLNFYDENDSIKIKFADNIKEIDFTYNIIKQTFDKYTGDILSIDEIKAYADNNNILCAYIDNSLCGIIQFEIKNGIVMWGHFAVDKRYRGNGAARKLMQEFFRLNAKDAKTRFQMWVTSDNYKALSIYKRIGFKFNNKITQSMIREN